MKTSTLGSPMGAKKESEKKKKGKMGCAVPRARVFHFKDSERSVITAQFCAWAEFGSLYGLSV